MLDYKFQKSIYFLKHYFKQWQIQDLKSVGVYYQKNSLPQLGTHLLIESLRINLNDSAPNQPLI